MLSEYQTAIRQSIAFVKGIWRREICSLVTCIRDYYRLVSGAVSLRSETVGGSSEELRGASVFHGLIMWRFVFEARASYQCWKVGGYHPLANTSRSSVLTKFVNDIDFLAFGLSGKIQLLPYFFVMMPPVSKGTEFRKRKYSKANFTYIFPTLFFPLSFVYFWINIGIILNYFFRTDLKGCVKILLNGLVTMF